MTIAASELRIGNVFKWNILASMGKGIDRVNLENIKYYEFFDGIPLTEEILLKCGFENNSILLSEQRILDIHDEGSVSFLDSELATELFKSTWNGRDDLFYNIMVIARNIKYLHTLQNLYFALTGKELEINL